MNDFTKEELKIIACNLCVTPKTISILEKLERMVNNYCEHHWRRSAIDAIYCPKCQKHVEYEE